MNIDLREELRKRDELLDGYLKQIEIQEEFIQKQKEMIEFLEDHISKITDIISGVFQKFDHFFLLLEKLFLDLNLLEITVKKFITFSKFFS